MKKMLLLILSIVFLTTTSIAQDRTTQHQESQVNKDTTNKSILEQLIIIRGLQEEAKQKRDEIWEKMNNNETELQEVPKNEYGAILQVEHNTRRHWYSDDWNLFGVLTFVLAIIAFAVSWGSYLYTKWSYTYTKETYFAQMKTEEHTTNPPIEVQIGKLTDLPRHFYRNLTCTCAIILKYTFEERKGRVYPSESNLRKLQTLPDDVILPIDVDKSEENNAYNYMHELKLLLRNYNVEVEVASEHLSRKNILKEALVQDFDNLLFKPLFLTAGTFDYKMSLQKNSLPLNYKESFVMDAITSILQEHFKKLSIPSNFNLLYTKQVTNYLIKIFTENGADFNKIDKKDGIVRSINYLLNYASKEELPNVITIDRKSIIDKIVKRLSKPENDFSFFFWGKKAVGDNLDFPGILSIANKEEFMHFCKGVGFTAGKVKCDVLYSYLAPYLNYLHQSRWNTVTLIKYILAIDAAIETDRIGMVNYN